MNKTSSELLYWCVVLAAYWYATYDGPPLRLVILYRGARACQLAAGVLGRLGFAMEARYYRTMGSYHGAN